MVHAVVTMFPLYLRPVKSKSLLSQDHCCFVLTRDRYSIRVGRSRSATGPFVDRNGGGYIVYGSHDYVVSCQPATS
jgi:hypothetical protein